MVSLPLAFIGEIYFTQPFSFTFKSKLAEVFY